MDFILSLPNFVLSAIVGGLFGAAGALIASALPLRWRSFVIGGAIAASIVIFNQFGILYVDRARFLMEANKIAGSRLNDITVIKAAGIRGGVLTFSYDLDIESVSDLDASEMRNVVIRGSCRAMGGAPSLLKLDYVRYAYTDRSGETREFSIPSSECR